MRIAILGVYAQSMVQFRGHLISEMTKAGHEVHALAPDCDPGIEDQLKRIGATFLPVRFNRTGMNPLADLISLFHFWKTFRRLKPDLLLAYTIKPVVFGTLAAKLAGVPQRYAMITGRGSTLHGEPKGFVQRSVRFLIKGLYRLALGQTNGVLFQNTDDLELFANEGMLPKRVRRTVVNGSGVDLEHYAPVPLPQGPIVFLFIGRLIRDKGIFEFGEACRILAKRREPGIFRIVGALDSNPSSIQASHLRTWEQEGIVEYLGPVDDIRTAIASAHVIVLPSYAEGTPRSVLEGMSMGRAIVTTQAPGCRETVQDGQNGFLVPVGDSAKLAEAMMRFIEDPELAFKCGKCSRKLAEDKYDVRLVTEMILTFLSISIDA